MRELTLGTALILIMSMSACMSNSDSTDEAPSGSSSSSGGSSSGSSSSGSVSEDPAASSADINAAYDAVQDAISAGDLTVADNLPSGTASLTGNMGFGGFGEDEDQDVISDLALEADFGASTITGTASNFGMYDTRTDELTDDIDGSMDIAGTISGTTMSATTSGTVSDADGSYDVSVSMDGTFYEDASDKLYVNGDATAVVDGEAHEGVFYAEEN